MPSAKRVVWPGGLAGIVAENPRLSDAVSIGPERLTVSDSPSSQPKLVLRGTKDDTEVLTADVSHAASAAIAANENTLRINFMAA